LESLEDGVRQSEVTKRGGTCGKPRRNKQGGEEHEPHIQDLKTSLKAIKVLSKNVEIDVAGILS